MKVLFLGTSEFALPSLKNLLGSSHEVLAVVTQPDRPKGRGQKLFPSAIKSLALAKNLPIFQPEKSGILFPWRFYNPADPSSSWLWPTGKFFLLPSSRSLPGDV